MRSEQRENYHINNLVLFTLHRFKLHKISLNIRLRSVENFNDVKNHHETMALLFVQFQNVSY